MKKQILTLLLAAGTLTANAGLQGSGTSVTGTLKDSIKGAGKDMLEIVDMAIIIGLAAALITVVYMVATKNQHAKEWVIGFIVAIIVYLVFSPMLKIV